jgi:Bacterial mobilisation protein (MobC)
MAGPRRRRRGPRPAPRKVEIRLTEAEHRAIRQAAARPGRGVSIARFVAEAALTAASATPPPPARRRSPSRLALAEIADAVTAVNRVGNNLNQLAREKNATGLRPVGTFVQIQRALTALDRLAGVVESGTETRR